MEAIIFTGLQASGKSTFYKQRFFDTHIRINLDMLKSRRREDLLLRVCIEMKQPFVVDNTNPTVKERAKYITAAKAAGFRVVGYYFRSKAQESIDRNNMRGGKQRVPPQAIYGAAKRLQIPSLSEGFDALYYVRVVESGEFSVEEWLEIT